MSESSDSSGWSTGKSYSPDDSVTHRLTSEEMERPLTSQEVAYINTFDDQENAWMITSGHRSDFISAFGFYINDEGEQIDTPKASKRARKRNTSRTRSVSSSPAALPEPQPPVALPVPQSPTTYTSGVFNRHLEQNVQEQLNICTSNLEYAHGRNRQLRKVLASLRKENAALKNEKTAQAAKIEALNIAIESLGAKFASI